MERVVISPGPMAGTNCKVTMLRCVGQYKATKRWRWSEALGEWSKTSYSAGARFYATEHTVNDLAELVQVLDAARRDPAAFIVRGDLEPGARASLAADPSQTIRRRKHLKNGIAPSLIEADRRWLMIDIDHWTLPGWADLADDPVTVIDSAIHALLPEPFHDVTCWWQLSASAGFAAGFLKVHLFYWLTKPASNKHLKAVLEEHAPAVDRAPFNGAQPHFIADPIIEGGYDPLPRRTGWHQGIKDAVALPDVSPVSIRRRPAVTTGVGHDRDIMGALAFMGKGERGQGFHAPLRAAILRYARRYPRAEDRDDEALKADLRAAIRSAPRLPGDDVETPYCQDNYLDSSIEGAFALLAGDTDAQAVERNRASSAIAAECSGQGAVASESGRRAALNPKSNPWQIKSPDPRRKRLARSAFSLLRQGADAAQFLEMLHAANRTLAEPMPAADVDGLALWCAERHAGAVHAR